MVFKRKRFLAFTLAEVLITLGIIGVVAAMTIPNLISDIEKKDLITANKKAKSVLANALKKASWENGGSLVGINLGKDLGNYIKLTKNCNTSSKNRYECWHATGEAKILQRDGSYANCCGGQTTGSSIIADGMFFRIPSATLTCDVGTGTATRGGVSCYTINYSNGYCGTFYIDVNGGKPPNVYGRDIREIQYWADGFIKFPGDVSATHSRWSSTRLQDDTSYAEGGDCYDPNTYSSDYLEEN